MQKTTSLVLAVLIIISLAALAAAGCGSQNNEAVPRPYFDGVEGYHVIVAGGEPEGVAAALAASRNGMNTLLVEEGDALGGLMTLGMLNFLDQNHGPGRILLTQGIFRELYLDLGNAFDIEEAKEWFRAKCHNEPNLTVMLGTEVIAPLMDGNTITGLEVKQAGSPETQTIRSHAVIDATVDGDVAAAAGAPYTVGGEDYGAHGLKQGVTLVFELGGVDWAVLTDHLRNDADPHSGVHDKAAWGFGNEALAYSPDGSDIHFRGPNIARLRNDNVLINALIIFGVDAHDRSSYSEAIARGSREIPHIVEFMRERFTGFEDAFFVRHASRLYVRETRHFVGEYRLTITDVLENRDHWDRIGHGSYPVDIQAFDTVNIGNIIGVPDIYSIPFRCLVPLEIDQLLIVGRSASYDSLPHGSTRVIPIGMVTGEAAGTAVAYSVQNSVSFRQMTNDPAAVKWLQNRLISRGAFLMEYVPPRKEVMDHWSYPGLSVLRELGLVAGGYENDYRLDYGLRRRGELRNVINSVISIASERTAGRGTSQIPAFRVGLTASEITIGVLLSTAAQAASLGDEFDDEVLAREYLIALGILNDSNLHHFTDLSEITTNAHLYSILGALYDYFMK